jgi:hypothetical protein
MAIEGFESLDFHAFHRDELPRRIAAGNGAQAAAAVARVGRIGSLALRLPSGDAYTYEAVDGTIRVREGDADADTVMELAPDCWEGLVHDYESPPGLLYGGRVACKKGKAIRLVNWEPALRALYTGRPLFDPETELRDRHGAPLDPEHAFRPGDDREDMAHFLRTAGYLLVREAFAPDEVARFAAEAAELRDEARKGDGVSWWAKDGEGHEVLCRVTRAGAKPGLATIPTDPRLLALVALSDHDLVARRGGDESVAVIWKLPAMKEGLADLPWHRDCGMGGHAVMCPVLIASVFLTPSTPETGELKFLPGSWTGTTPYMDATDPRAPRGASFAARPGDVSLHYGDVMHAAPPPRAAGLERYRISAVTGYARADARNHLGGRSYNDPLHGREDGQVEHLEDVARRKDA